MYIFRNHKEGASDIYRSLYLPMTVLQSTKYASLDVNHNTSIVRYLKSDVSNEFENVLQFVTHVKAFVDKPMQISADKY
jgi:hypothetical protein